MAAGLNGYQKRIVADFLSAFSMTDAALPERRFYYCSLMQDSVEWLIAGRLFVEGMKPDAEYPSFQSNSVRAGEYALSDLSPSVEHFIEAVGRGEIVTPHGLIKIPESDAGTFGTTFEPFHSAGDGLRNRLAVLSFVGKPWNQLFDIRQINWELKGNDIPYDSLQELFQGYRLDMMLSSTLEIVLQPAVQVDLDCEIDGKDALVGVVLPAGIPNENVSLGYRIVSSVSKPTQRGTLSSAQLDWKIDGKFQRGRHQFEVEPGSVVQCFARFAGQVQNHGFIADPNNFQNNRRAAYEVFDRRLSTLNEFLFRPVTKGIQARDFEAAVSFLLWMLGFNPVLLGLFPKIQDGPDILVTSPLGDYLVIECTLGLLKANDKLASVVQRSTLVRQALEKCGHSHLRVIPVMVSCLTREELKAEAEDADRNGVFVISREGLEEGIQLSLIAPNPNKIFDLALSSMAAGQTKSTRSKN
ncbi:hypothetical protein FP026_29500 [Rhizobium tropici]|uniref:Uncharacterized protein n=1 Tax=Rhizobium tropici TaxID=398 RepID=A0A5B0VL03_RHITR|nr:hypothetical protein [Rhizobium tropici]KAA1175287.1 hypothetical protein FP026_29500 [Rhizobium tropici]